MKISWKKVLGVMTVLVILYISVYAVHQKVDLTLSILTQDILLALGLFGIKTYSGLQSKKMNGGNNA